MARTITVISITEPTHEDIASAFAAIDARTSTTPTRTMPVGATESAPKTRKGTKGTNTPANAPTTRTKRQSIAGTVNGVTAKDYYAMSRDERKAFRASAGGDWSQGFTGRVGMVADKPAEAPAPAKASKANIVPQGKGTKREPFHGQGAYAFAKSRKAQGKAASYVSKAGKVVTL